MEAPSLPLFAGGPFVKMARCRLLFEPFPNPPDRLMILRRLSLLFSAGLFALLGQSAWTEALAQSEVRAPGADEPSASVPAQGPLLASSIESLGPPSDVWDRIRRGYSMPMLESPLVDKWVRYYRKDPAYLDRMFNRSGRYLYHIIEEVEARGMPTELALLPFVESAFQPEALSRAKAAGLWQFMPQTGKTYSLAQNLWRDDRQDVLESTRAALDYFQYLYGLFDDWHLALAAYNWGEGSVQRAMKRQRARKRPTDYLHLRMPNETANYVPKLEAIKRIVSDPKKYGVELPDVGNEPFFVSITKPRDIDVETAARLADMRLEDFKKLNPSFKLPVIVAAHNNIMLLPVDKLDGFIDNLASWMDTGQPLSQWRTYKLGSGETLASVAENFGMTEAELRRVNGIPKGRKVLANSTLLVKSTDDEQYDISEDEMDARLQLSPLTTWRKVTYRVRRGDTIYKIARRWRISAKSIRNDNRLRGDMLRIGQRLTLTVPRVQRMPVIAPATTAKKTSGSPTIHAVRRGDSLSQIARRYGVTVAAIKRTNRLRSNNIKVGQRLRIYAPNQPEPQLKYHTVVSGDTISEIAERYGVSLVRLKRANQMTSNFLRVGQRLEIPASEGVSQTKRAVARVEAKEAAAPQLSSYKVRKGDSLYSISRRFGVTIAKMREVNGLKNNFLKVGQNLVIPATAPVRPVVQAKATVPTQTRYKVRRGDSLIAISKRFNVSVSSLRKLNRLNGSMLREGQQLRIQ